MDDDDDDVILGVAAEQESSSDLQSRGVMQHSTELQDFR